MVVEFVLCLVTAGISEKEKNPTKAERGHAVKAWGGWGGDRPFIILQVCLFFLVAAPRDVFFAIKATRAWLVIGMGLRKYALNTSGATLGFIGGNLPGAYLGYKAGSYIDRKMAPVHRRNTAHRKRPLTQGVRGVRQKASMKVRRSNGRSFVKAMPPGRAARARARRGGGKGDDSAKSFFNNVHRTKTKFMKGFKKVAAPTFLNCALSQRLLLGGLSLSGEQNPFELDSWKGGTGVAEPVHFGPAMMTDVQNALAAIEPTPATQNSAGNLTAATRKIFIKSCTTAYTMKNVTNSPVRVVLYDCVLRRDQQVLVRPSTVWNDGVLDEAVTVPGAGTITNARTFRIPGATPFQSQKFCQYFKVRKVTKYELHPGSIHVHRVTTKPGGLLSNELTTNFYMRGLATYVMAVVTGGIEDDATTTLGAGTVSTSAFAVDVVTETRIEATTFERSRSAYVQWNTLATGTTYAAQNIMNEDLDTPQPLATA